VRLLAEEPTPVREDTTGRFIASAVDTLTGTPLTPLFHSVPDQLGPWKICEFIGRGGMGEVWRAERSDGLFEMDVAVKILRSDRADVLDRFKREREVLARLDHQHIARLIDAGITPEGLPYLVADFVQGVPLDRWCAVKQPKLRERLQLFLQVCDAVAYAHSELVVHRDLKPGNILIDADDNAQLLDFGIAKLVSSDAQEDVTDESPHTPEYAAPEQVQGGAITVRTDVYALGLVLYLLLTGTRPQARVGPLAEQIERILQHVPPPASHALQAQLETNGPLASNVSALSKGIVKNLSVSELQGDLDAVIAKAIAKLPNERYASVAELATDIRSFLTGRIVTARHASAWERTRRALRRRAPLIAVSVLTAASVLGLAGLTLFQAGSMREAKQFSRIQQQNAQAREAEALAARAFISSMLKDVEVQGKAGPVLARRARAYTQSTLVSYPELQAAVVWEVAGVYQNFGLFEERANMLREHFVATQTRADLNAQATAACAHAAQLAESGDRTEARFLLRFSDQLLVAENAAPWAKLHCARIGGRALRFLGQYEQAEARILQGLDLMRSRYQSADGSVYHSQYIDALSALAVAQLQSAHIEQAEQTLQEFAALLRSQGRDHSSQMANFYSNMAIIKRDQGKLDEALSYSNRDLDLQSLREPGAINPQSICARAHLAYRMQQPDAKLWAQRCEARLVVEKLAPKLVRRENWAELAEAAALAKDSALMGKAEQAMLLALEGLDANERELDVPYWRLRVAQASLSSDGALIAELKSRLNEFDVRVHSSLAPMQARVRELAAR
jgi:eukaryotic-like serine/threonine-protein kinase